MAHDLDRRKNFLARLKSAPVLAAGAASALGLVVWLAKPLNIETGDISGPLVVFGPTIYQIRQAPTGTVDTLAAQVDGASGTSVAVVNVLYCNDASYLFCSDFETGTGSSAAIVLDSSVTRPVASPRPWDFRVGLGPPSAFSATLTRVIAGASDSLGFPTANVLRIVEDSVNASQARAANIRIHPLNAATTWPRIEPGASRYYTFYVRMRAVDSNAWNECGGHPVQDGTSGSNSNWYYVTYVKSGCLTHGNYTGPVGDSTQWDLQWQFVGASSGPSMNNNNSKWRLVGLKKHQTYRVTTEIARGSGATVDSFSVNITVLCCNGADTLSFDDNDFFNLNDSDSLVNLVQRQRIGDSTSFHHGFQAGTNGALADGSAPFVPGGWPFQYMDQGGFCIRDGAPCPQRSN